MFASNAKIACEKLSSELSKFNQATNALALALTLKEIADSDESNKAQLKLEACYLGSNSSANRQWLNGERKSGKTVEVIDLSDLGLDEE